MSDLAVRKSKDMDMTSGPLWNKILIFAIPLALTTLMQQLFHSMDMAVIGRFEGQNELAAVGSNNSIINFLVNMFMGFSAGSNVVIAQLLGAGKLKTAKKAICTSLGIAVFSGLCVMVLGVVFSPFLLKLISTPPEIINLSTLYLRIYFLGIPFLMIYNFAAAILRSRGETTKPFFCLVTGGVVNVILNLIFVAVFKLSVAGVAIATSVSNLISCILILMILFKDKGPLGIRLNEISIDKFILSKIFKIGLPISIQSCLFPISNMVVQSSVNSLGATVVAGNAAASSIESFSYSIMGGFSQATVSFVSQNFGAKNIKRCRKSYRECVLLGILVIGIFNILLYLGMDTIISFFTDEHSVALVTKERLSFMYNVFLTAFLMDTATYALRGMGYSVIPTITSVVGVCGFRILWLTTVFKIVKTYKSILVVYPISWCLVAIILIICYFVIVKKLEKRINNEEKSTA